MCSTSQKDNNRNTEKGSMSDLKSTNLLKKDLEMLYTNKIQTDLKLKVETEVFNVHKCILSARSPVFRTMFEQDMIESQTGVVEITDIDSKTLDMLLKYMYTDSCSQLDCESALNLILAADKYQVNSLKKECSDYLISILSEKNVCDILNVADMVFENSLKVSSMEYVKSHADKVLLSDSWQEFVKNNVSLASETLSKLSTNFGAAAMRKKEIEIKSKSSIPESPAQQLPTVSMNQPSTSNTARSETRAINYTQQVTRHQISTCTWNPNNCRQSRRHRRSEPISSPEIWTSSSSESGSSSGSDSGSSSGSDSGSSSCSESDTSSYSDSE